MTSYSHSVQSVPTSWRMKMCIMWCSHMFMRVNEDVYQCLFLDLYRPRLTLRTIWLYHKMQYVHPLGCGHTLYNVGVWNHYKSLANFISCLLAKLHWYRSELTLRTMWLYHKMHFVHPPGCGHTVSIVRVRNYHESLANFICHLSAEFHWYRSKLTLRTMWLHHEMHFLHPPGCGHTLSIVRVRNCYKSLANFVSCLLAELYWYRSELTLRTMWLHHKMHFVHPPGCGHTLSLMRVRNQHESLANFISWLSAEFHWYKSKFTLSTLD